MDKKNTLIPIRDSLAGLLLKRIFGLYLIVASIVTIIQIGIDYYSVQNNFNRELIAMAQASEEVLSEAIWSFNSIMIDAELRGLIKNERVIGIRVLDTNLEEIQKVGKTVTLQTDEELITKGFISVDNAYFALIWPVIHSDARDDDIVIGYLQLFSATDLVIAKVTNNLLFVISNAIIKTTALWLIVLYALNTILTKPLVSMTKDINNIDDENIVNTKPFQGYTTKGKELLDLQNGFVMMLERLRHSFKALYEKDELLTFQSKYDSLTKISNRVFFEEESVRLLSRAKRHKKTLGLLFFDLNGFKKINDSYGHAVGDELLILVAKTLKNYIRETDIVSRMSGDEFVVMTDVLEKEEEIYLFVQRLLEAFNTPFNIQGHNIICNPSIGVALYPKAKNISQLLKYADLAMYEAKNIKEPKGSVCFYTNEMEKKYSRIQTIEEQLHLSIPDHQLTTVFQPVINLKETQLIEVEALVRWNSSSLGWVSPDEFIPIAESSQLINEVTKCVLDDCKKLYFYFKNKGLNIQKIAINLSASQFTDSAFTELLIDWIDKTEMSSDVICLELTERQLIDNAEQCNEQIQKLRKKGFKVALDDFGTGYSSLTHLLKFPIDILKIDRILIDQIDSNSLNQALVAGIVEMSHRLGLDVIAEGVEREEEKEKVTNMGCDFIQGYYFSKPLSADDLFNFYNDR